ncbi:DUF302 domain-containing protein [Silvimonas iriomotensis]|uniref:DUF302 domain-containing protein n=1 Tax=Silvimonas iriomotensis TaxID=449662 RepID=A0ABQ2P8U1_9NEIS|nr:DUF302 domain-containing protein [Silvimonas iriomotensis]GGP21192.1 hypothetical protein GCM10010970_19270 [Silvimonas iriomotensis]
MSSPIQNDPDLTEITSRHDFDATVTRLTQAIEAAGMTVFARLDHAAGAEAVGLSMPPTVVLVYGNPRAGTPLMLQSPRFALDLPLRVLIRQAGNQVLVAYHPVQSSARAAGIADNALSALQKAQALLEITVTG